MTFIECVGFPLTHSISIGITLPTGIHDECIALGSVGSCGIARQERTLSLYSHVLFCDVFKCRAFMIN